ncbi:MAG: TetR/AcrR family transcriptional regulator [Chloroflexi bacterium]|nr:TetR/AcrR family transcriptional regulator [Chloroflexota bacterium]
MAQNLLSRNQKTRQDILRAAHDLFVQQGYHGTSMRQIAKNAHMALGGLYNYFESKEAVFKDVFWEYHPYRDILPYLNNAEGDTVEEFIHHATTLLEDALFSHPDFLNLMFIEMVEFKGIHTSEIFQAIFPQGMQIAQGFLKRFQDQIRPISPYIFMRSLLSLFFGFFITGVVISKYTPPEFNTDAMRQITDIYLHGLLERK